MAKGFQFEATDERKRLVKGLVAFGIPQMEIAKLIGCGDRTLRAKFRHELDIGKAEAVAKVANFLFQKATSGNSAHNITAAIFYLKAQGQWRTTDRVEHTGADGGPIEVNSDAKERLTRLIAGHTAATRDSAGAEEPEPEGR